MTKLSRNVLVLFKVLQSRLLQEPPTQKWHGMILTLIIAGTVTNVVPCD